MGSNRRYAWRLVGRVLVLLVALAATAALAAFERAPTATLLALSASVLAALGLWRLVNEANRELARFVAALERFDLGQSFRRDRGGTGFEELGSAYERALERLRRERAGVAATARTADALVDGAPTPLLLIDADGTVRFANTAARRLFGRREPCALAALAPFGAAFVEALAAAAPGATRLSQLLLDGLPQRVTLDVTRLDLTGQSRRIVAVSVIQAELDGAELAAQIDLVRVLTHEVMNSLTPVTSLAATAARLIGGVDSGAVPAIADARLAVDALARRAAELERFVTSYKGFSEAPALHRTAIGVRDWFAQLDALFATTPAAQGATLAWSIAAGMPTIDGDAALLTQVMLNLLKNAGEAAAGTAAPAIGVEAAPASDGRVRIRVTDNGPGIPPELERDVLLPFFTTKPTGTGIGLSLARQVVMLHGGRIGIVAREGGCLELLLPAARG